MGWSFAMHLLGCLPAFGAVALLAGAGLDGRRQTRRFDLGSECFAGGVPGIGKTQVGYAEQVWCQHSVERIHKS